MTLQAFRDVLLHGDSGASHYTSMQQPNYTVWQEVGDDSPCSDDARDDLDMAWNIQVDRFTKTEYDPIVTSISEALTRADICYEYLVDYEKETGFIHHIWDCKVI